MTVKKISAGGASAESKETNKMKKDERTVELREKEMERDKLGKADGDEVCKEKELVRLRENMYE